MAVQFTGYKPMVNTKAAKVNAGRGFRLIDINFERGVKKVVNDHAGSALIGEKIHIPRIPVATGRTVNLRAISNLPITSKTRAGSRKAQRARVTKVCCIRMITGHSRTYRQFYTGTVDLKFMGEVEERMTIFVIVNDISRTCLALIPPGFRSKTRRREVSHLTAWPMNQRRPRHRRPIVRPSARESFVAQSGSSRLRVSPLTMHPPGSPKHRAPGQKIIDVVRIKGLIRCFYEPFHVGDTMPTIDPDPFAPPHFKFPNPGFLSTWGMASDHCDRNVGGATW
jgi:hypothetical protein